MYQGKTVFAQVMAFLPLHQFQKCVARYHGNYKTRNFSCLDQLLVMAFAQITCRESLRDIEVCLRTMQSRLYHMGIHGKVSRTTLADANEKRDWRIFADFAQVLIHQARPLYRDEPFGVDLENTVYALDATMIELCLSVFPWARYMHGPTKLKGAVKLHTELDLRGSIPTFVSITDGKVYDTCLLDQLLPEPGSIYIMDRGYLDFGRLYRFHQCQAFFVVRNRAHIRLKRFYSQPADHSLGIRCDQIVVPAGVFTADKYPQKIRRVRYVDPETGKDLDFLTNHFVLPALTVAQLYKCRWQIELFFKWIKQHLRIKSFYGTSMNAVKIQIWVAISVYVLVAIIKKQLRLDCSLYTFLQILSVTAFEKVPLYQLLTETKGSLLPMDHKNQLELFKL